MGLKAGRPQDVPLWHVDYFELKTNQGPKDSGRTSELPPYHLKEFKIGGLSEEGAITTDNCSKVLGMVDKRNLRKAHLIKLVCVPLSLNEWFRKLLFTKY